MYVNWLRSAKKAFHCSAAHTKSSVQRQGSTLHWVIGKPHSQCVLVVVDDAP